MMAAESEIETHRADVLDCVSRMEVQTTWDQCRTLMFQPCQMAVVGSDGHVACLTEMRNGWSERVQTRFFDISDRLSDDGKRTVAELPKQWLGNVAEKCTIVAQAKAEISAASARQGCETSETIGLVAELEACLDGRSNAPYCELRD